MQLVGRVAQQSKAAGLPRTDKTLQERKNPQHLPDLEMKKWMIEVFHTHSHMPSRSHMLVSGRNNLTLPFKSILAGIRIKLT